MQLIGLDFTCLKIVINAILHFNNVSNFVGPGQCINGYFADKFDLCGMYLVDWMYVSGSVGLRNSRPDTTISYS